MSQFSPQDLLSVLASLVAACFCGLVPMGFAAVAWYAARKRSETTLAVSKARRVNIAGVRPGMGLVRLQGRIAPHSAPLDGSAENALVYLRLRVEEYERDQSSGWRPPTDKARGIPFQEEHEQDQSSGWRPLTDKARGIPFQIEDGSGSVWVNPEGLDKQLLGEGFVPNDDQIQAACILLGIPPDMLRGQLRFRMWEMRAGQNVSVVGTPQSNPQGEIVIARAPGQPFLVSLLLGQALDATLASQTRQARNWVLFLGIPGVVFFLCGLCWALISLIRALPKG